MRVYKLNIVEGDTGVFIADTPHPGFAENLGKALVDRFSKRGEKIIVVENVQGRCYLLTDRGLEDLGEFELEDTEEMMNLVEIARGRGKRLEGDREV